MIMIVLPNNDCWIRSYFMADKDYSLGSFFYVVSDNFAKIKKTLNWLKYPSHSFSSHPWLRSHAHPHGATPLTVSLLRLLTKCRPCRSQPILRSWRRCLPLHLPLTCSAPHRQRRDPRSSLRPRFDPLSELSIHNPSLWSAIWRL
jgi:hypothetical protein